MDGNCNGRCTRAELIQALRKDPRLQKLLDLPAHITDNQRGLFEAVFQVYGLGLLSRPGVGLSRTLDLRCSRARSLLGGAMAFV